MKQRITQTFVTIFSAVALSAGAVAQEPAANDAAAATGDPASEATTQQNALKNIQLFYAALDSEEVGQDIKNVLLGCVYQNSMRDITVAMDNSIEASTAEIDRSDNGTMIGLMATVCGYQSASAGDQATGSR